MGMVYRRTYKRKDGTAATVTTWSIKYYQDGRPFWESTGTRKKREAKRLLKLREGDVERGLPVVPHAARVTFDELAGDVVTDYRVNGKKSIDDLVRRFDKHLKPFFGARRRMVSITTPDIQQYVVRRQGAKVSNAQINRELSALKRTFNLAMQSGKVLHKPYIAMLRENNVRTGFFEPAQFEAVRSKLSRWLRPLVFMAYITGWRTQSELLPLQWRQVDFEGGTVRLDVGTTKNGEGRVFPLTAELRALLEAQREATRTIEQAKGIICPFVFHRSGKRIRNLRKAWKKACTAAGCPARIPHDFRRTAVRNLVRAGIPERVAMTMTGHKTRSVFERYNIVSEGDLADAAKRLDAAMDKSGHSRPFSDSRGPNSSALSS